MAKRAQRSFSWLINSIANGSQETLAHFAELVELRPKLVVPHIPDLASLLNSSRAPVRKASLEMLAILSRVAPGAMAFLIPTLHELLANEPQNAIAGYASEILLNYAQTSKEAAQKVVPILRSSAKKLKPRLALHISRAIKELS